MKRQSVDGLGPVLLIVFFVWCTALGLGASQGRAGEDTTSIVIRGSGSLLPLVERWVSSYSSTTSGIGFDVGAEGSDEGIRDLLLGKADIAAVSRPMSPEEHAASHEKGLPVRKTVVARMGIAVVIHPSNPVKSVPVQKLADVFAGEVQNWEALGGPDETIMVVRKEDGWSPRFFQDRVMGGKQYLSGGLVVDSKEVILAEVSQRPWAIGITGLPEAMPALDRVKLVRLESGTSDGGSTYALSRPLYFFSAGSSSAVQSFLEFVISAKAQLAISDPGFFPAQQGDQLE